MKAKTISFIGNDAIESPCIRDSDCSCKSDKNIIISEPYSNDICLLNTYFNYS